MPQALLLSILTLVLLGCRPGDDGATDREAATIPVEEQESEDIDACRLFSPGLVSVAANVPEDDLLQTGNPLGCAYIWRGGSASFGPFYIFESGAEAEAFFRETFRQLSREEAEEVTQQSLAFVDQQAEAGMVSEADAEAMRRDAVLREEALQTVAYESIGGIGDRALYDGSVRPTVQPYVGETLQAESNLAVLLRNVVFVVSGNRTDTFGHTGNPAEQHLRENREFTLALARRTVEEILQAGG